MTLDMDATLFRVNRNVVPSDQTAEFNRLAPSLGFAEAERGGLLRLHGPQSAERSGPEGHTL